MCVQFVDLPKVSGNEDRSDYPQTSQSQRRCRVPPYSPIQNIAAECGNKQAKNDNEIELVLY